MNTIPKTIRQILAELDADREHTAEDAVSFLNEVICLYEDYEGLSDGLVFLAGLLKEDANSRYKEYLPIVEIFSYLCSERGHLLLEEQKEIQEQKKNLEIAQSKFLETDDDVKYIQIIAESAYYLNEPVVHVAAQMLCNQIERGISSKDNIGKQVLNGLNIGFLIESLQDKGNTFVLIANGQTSINYDILANMISRLGHTVIIMIPDDSIGASEEECIKLIKEYGDIVVVPYSEAVLCQLIHHCRLKYSKDNMVCLIGAGYLLDQLSLCAGRECEIERLTSMKSAVLENKLTYGWAGDYLSYISRIYKCNAHKELDARPEYKFSIIIPTRGPVETLRHTLQTCISQRWDGDYEIVVSDNSLPENTSVYELCKEMNHDKIHYIKTPRPLAIGRNFEYAFLKSRGEFLIPIGSDDGLLPWTLEVLAEVLENVDDEIITWERGQYQWPDFGKGMSDLLQFPCSAEKGRYEVDYIAGANFLNNVLRNPQNMYMLPLLYINSGFKRSYMKTLIQKTGRLWDGPCQDIFMGIINSVINKNICRIRYPLTIAGMAQYSTGQKYTRLLDSFEKVVRRSKNKDLGESGYIGGWASSAVERNVPRITSDIGLCYNCMMRVVAKNILPLEFARQYFDMKRWFIEIYSLMNKKELIFERQLRELRFAAAYNGLDFLQWFEAEIMAAAMQKEEDAPISEDMEEKRYVSKVLDDGTVILDASKYGVQNIYQAMRLVEKVSQF